MKLIIFPITQSREKQVSLPARSELAAEMEADYEELEKQWEEEEEEDKVVHNIKVKNYLFTYIWGESGDNIVVTMDENN